MRFNEAGNLLFRLVFTYNAVLKQQQHTPYDSDFTQRHFPC